MNVHLKHSSVVSRCESVCVSECETGCVPSCGPGCVSGFRVRMRDRVGARVGCDLLLDYGWSLCGDLFIIVEDFCSSTEEMGCVSWVLLAFPSCVVIEVFVSVTGGFLRCPISSLSCWISSFMVFSLEVASPLIRLI